MIEDIDVEETIGNSYDYESAMEECGFGCFNILLLFACLPGLWTTIFEIYTISYVLPVAVCDLSLTLYQKAALNAATFSGTILSALPWGFIADTFSRKYVLVVGLLMEGFLLLLSSFSKTFEQLMVFKFFGGMIVCGPSGGFMSYISEFHGKKHRMIVVILVGFINALPPLILPICAHLIIPKNTSIEIGTLKVKSWQLLIATTALPAFLSSVLLMFFPESPKFLMSRGQTNDATRVFRTIYSFNKFKKQKNVPIFTIIDGNPEEERLKYPWRQFSLKEQKKRFYDSLKKFRIFFTKSYVLLTLKACIMQMPLAATVYAASLWLPETTAIYGEMTDKGLKQVNYCNIFDYLMMKHNRVRTEQLCEVHSYSMAYHDNMIVASSSLLNFLFTSIVVRYIGNNILLRSYLVIACICYIVKYCSYSHTISVFLTCIGSSCGSVSSMLTANSIVNLYPTSVRTMTLLILFSCGRMGGVLGNLFYPLLMKATCIGLFIIYGSNYLYAFVISFFLPDTTEENLK